MKKYTKAAISIGIAAATLQITAYADHGRDHRDHGHDDWNRHGTRDQYPPLKVALWGDEFYNDDPTAKASMIDQAIASMNDHDLDFTIFVGDTKNGSSLCTDEAIGQEPQAIFDRLDAPTLYSLGDNEWTDCHRTNNGSVYVVYSLFPVAHWGGNIN